MIGGAFQGLQTSLIIIVSVILIVIVIVIVIIILIVTVIVIIIPIVIVIIILPKRLSSLLSVLTGALYVAMLRYLLTASFCFFTQPTAATHATQHSTLVTYSNSHN